AGLARVCTGSGTSEGDATRVGMARALRFGVTQRRTTAPRTVFLAGAMLCGAACTDRGVQVGGETSGEQTGTTGSSTTERATNSDGHDRADSTGDDAPEGSSTGGETPATTGGDSDGSSGSTGAVVDDCWEVRATATLCGPAPSPCAIVLDEPIDDPQPYRWVNPPITIDADCAPQLHYLRHVDNSDPVGHLAYRTADGTWNAELTPFAYGRGLHYDRIAGRMLATVGEDAPRLWTRDGRWAEQAAVDDVDWYATAAGVDGEMFVATHGDSGDEDVLRLHTWDPEDPGALATTVIDQGDIRSAFDVGGGASPNVAWWAFGEGGVQLLRSDGAGAVEVIDTVDPDAGEHPAGFVAIADGGEHVLYRTDHATPPPATQSEIRYARRDSDGDWQVSTLLAEDPDGFACSDPFPTTPDQTCDYDYTDVRVLDIVTNEDGDVRLLFAHEHHIGHMVASNECPGPGAWPTPLTYWWCPEGSVTSRLFVGWPDDAGGVALQPLDTEHRLAGVTTVVDAEGGINIAARVTEDDLSLGMSIRYLRLR
ncbi:MAG: hypothetical protein AAF721_13080, partial [Myxococcota bacterium]